MTYRAPLADIAFALKHASRATRRRWRRGLLRRSHLDDVDAVLDEAGRFATEVIAPLNRVGDRHGTPFKDGDVTTPPGWKEAYRAWAAAGWNGLAAPAEWGGQDAAAGRSTPPASRCGTRPRWRSASARCSPWRRSMRSRAHGSEALKRAYLPKLVSGEWMGTMQLTEPQAGSDVGALRTRAERAARRQLSHHRPEDLHHLWRARPHRQHHSLRAGAAARRAAGTRGISLFLVPKFLLNADGTLGARNDVRAHSVEHKLGIQRLADLHHGLWRPRRRHGLSRRRGEPRHGLHVHHDERGAARGRPAGRRHRRSAPRSRRSPMRASAARAVAGAMPAARPRRSSPIPTCKRMLHDHARAHRARRARSATRPRSRSTAPSAAPDERRAQGRA